jgi:ribosomal protein S18 acetylase RimI-like enzyme
MSTKAHVKLYGSNECHKTLAYKRHLEELGVDHKFLDVQVDAVAAEDLRSYYADRRLNYPTIAIGERRLRNPPLLELEKELRRSGVLSPAVIHEPESQRFVRHMQPSDAFVSYVSRGDTMVLTHIEVAPEHRGSGLGAELAREVFTMVRMLAQSGRITCPFMRRVAMGTPEDREFFRVN